MGEAKISGFFGLQYCLSDAIDNRRLPKNYGGKRLKGGVLMRMFFGVISRNLRGTKSTLGKTCTLFSKSKSL